MLCDTGPLVAAAIKTDRHHGECVDLFAGLSLAGRAIVVPPTVVAGVGYLMNRFGVSRVEADFLLSISDGTFEPVNLTPADYRRAAAADLVIQYSDLRLGTTDGTVIALAERLGIDDIATLDRRHFTVVRPRHTRALTLLP